MRFESENEYRIRMQQIEEEIQSENEYRIRMQQIEEEIQEVA